MNRKVSSMKKRMAALLLAACLMAGLSIPGSAAETDSSAQQTVQALGIMTGDTDGQMYPDRAVSRAELTRMLTAASSFRDTVSSDGSGYSLFQDVKNTHWASEYIRLAVQQGWMVGYTDGTFRPDQTVKLEEACSALLRLLGYTSDDLAGSFPQAQLSKAAALGLRDQLTAVRGQNLTRRDCMYLFYNLLTAKTASGQVYAATLGYPLTNGKVDYAAVLSDSLSGPYVYDGTALHLPFQAVKVYQDGKESSLSAISEYDVYYYNAGLQTVWMYTDRISGSVTALSPSGTSPTSVTVAGQTYSIGSPDAAYALSALNGTRAGTMVTLLLGMDGSVAAVLTGNAVDATYYGVVQLNTKTVSTDGDAAIQTQLTMACTDGNVHTFVLDQEAGYTPGALVSVTVTNGKTTAKGLPVKSASGKVNKDGTKLGDLTLADNIRILDTGKDGGYVSVPPLRLANRTLNTNDVRYYVLDADGKVSHLILNDVTGDTWIYGYLISVEEGDNSGTNVLMAPITYRYMVNGTEQVITGSTVRYPVTGGQAVAIRYDRNGGVTQMKSTESVRVSQLGATDVRADNRTYTLAENVQVYLRQNGEYYQTGLDSIDTENYSVTGYYDNFGCSAGGLIRVLIAVRK